MRIETTPPVLTPMLISLCHDLNPDVPPMWVDVVAEKGALQNECFPNVEQKIKKDGGGQVNGWVIWQWANMMIEAEAHSVWKSDAGTLLDITPHNYGEQRVLFVPDENIKYQGCIIPSKRAPMTASQKIARLIDLLNARDFLFEKSGTRRTCALPEPMYLEIQSILAEVKQKASRNDPCPCGSGQKFKKCCGMYER